MRLPGFHLLFLLKMLKTNWLCAYFVLKSA